MHELTLCFNLIRILEQSAHSTSPPITRIKTVWLEIGELAGIDLDAIRFSFPIAATHTLAKDATLKIKTQAGQAYCNSCDKNVIISSLLAPCAICGQYNYTITQGKAFRVIKMETT